MDEKEILERANTLNKLSAELLFKENQALKAEIAELNIKNEKRIYTIFSDMSFSFRKNPDVKYSGDEVAEAIERIRTYECIVGRKSVGEGENK